MKKSLLTLLTVLCCVAFINAATPFKVTAIENGTFAAGTTWYTMAIGTGGKIISDNDGAEHIALGRATTQYEDCDLWCFVGNDTDGYAIYNKQAGPTKVLASHTTMSNINGFSGTGGSTYPTMQPANELPTGYIGLWDFTSTDKIENVDGYIMKIHGTDYAVNNFGNRGMLAFWAEGADAGSTIYFTMGEGSTEVLASTGSFTASNAGKTWHSKWESSEIEGLSINTGYNNMKAVGDNIAGYSGTGGSSTYTLTAPEDMCIAEYSFDYVNTENESYSLTLTVDGKTYSTSGSKQSIKVIIEEPQRTASFTQSGANKGITFSNFRIVIKPNVIAPEPSFDVFPTLTSQAIPYRIPAIATASNGDIIAVADYRHSRADIGMANNGRIDLRARISKDNGKTWGDIFDIICGQGAQSPDSMHVGFGDPCIVADRESSRVLVISCSGNVSFPAGQRHCHQGIAHFYSDDYGVNWSEPVDRSESIYAQFDNTSHGPVRAMFVGSGKISQSQYIKVGDYYRIYCAVLVKNVNGTHVNFVLYSDDFGGQWTVLGGGEVSPIPGGGDEPKADELPDGSVIISSRTTGGRYFNIFTYTDSKKAEGSWGTSQFSGNNNNGTTAVSNSTNGEIMFVPARRKADDKKVYLALQSVPLGSGRANVGIYYKELETLADFISPQAFAADWNGRHQASYLSSAYSTMTLQKDNNIGFLYEEDTYGTNGGGYTIVYKNYSIEYITDSTYIYDETADRNAIVLEGIDAKSDALQSGDEGTYIGCIKPESFEQLEAAIEEYKTTPQQSNYEALNATIANLERYEVEPHQWYRIRNKERSSGTLYLKPEDSRITAATTSKSINNLFTFIPTSEGADEYYLYNGNYEYYLGPLGANETQPTVTTDAANAGKWEIQSSSTGQSSIICTNKTGGNVGLHLAGDNTRLVPWTATADASLWYIEPATEYTMTINEVTAVCMPFTMTLPDGVTAYVAGSVEKDSDGVEYIPITEYGSSTIAAGTPVILEAASGSYTVAIGGAAEPYDGTNNLKGVLKSKSVSGSDVYRLNSGKFTKRTSSTGSITSNNAYYTTTAEATTLPLIKSTATSIDGIETEKSEAEFYDLKGNRVNTLKRGIYITSQGEKVVVF